jgi:alpha-L-fucosidase
VATFGNDGTTTTRWCAANSGLNHYWQVDLGASHTLGRIDITWEKSANYKFKIEGSSDNNAWAMLLDKQATTGSASMQSYALDTSPSARWVRITVTGLPTSTTWASFYELQVFGH